MSETAQLLLTISGWIVPTVLGPVLGWLASKNAENKKRNAERELEDAAMREALKAILRTMLKEDHEKYTRQGYCPIKSKEEVDTIYNCYHNLGGNGLGTSFRNDIVALPDDKPNDR